MFGENSYLKTGLGFSLATHIFCYYTDYSIWKVGLIVTGVASIIPFLIGYGISAKANDSMYFWATMGMFLLTIGAFYWMPLGIGSLIRFGVVPLLKN